MQELLQTEQHYIRALNYVLDNYVPEIMSETVPQPLRGKRNVVFGNIQNICKFHTEAFMREIEACMQSPYQLGDCFLRHVIIVSSMSPGRTGPPGNLALARWVRLSSGQVGRHVKC